MSSFSNTGWAKKKSQGILSASNPVPIAAIPNIHEATEQTIQGGAANQHWHLNTAEHTAVLAGMHKYVCLELLFSQSGAAMNSLTGDGMFQKVTGTHAYY